MPDESPPYNIPEAEDVREVELPRWLQVPIGIILSLFTLLCGFASACLVLVPNKKAPIFAFVSVVILLLGCAWVLAKCFRLITGRKHRGGLMSPRALRIVSVCLLVFPVIGLFGGYYREVGAIAIFQAVMYFFGFFGLRELARKRENYEANQRKQKAE
jgi:amino acid transporter